jgi:hypothetical protein
MRRPLVPLRLPPADPELNPFKPGRWFGFYKAMIWPIAVLVASARLFGWRDTVSNLTRITFTGSGYRTYPWISFGYHALTTPRLPYTVNYLKAGSGISSETVLCPPT